MNPIHKFNNGRGATLCHTCSVIISTGLTKDLYCDKCKEENMKIDKLIELLDVEEAIIIVNKKTIDSFFDDIEGISGESATFDMPIHMGARAIYRNSTNIYFVDQEDLEDIKFKKI